MILNNYHTHTVFSDGTDTVRACVEAARERGMTGLGISDHSMTPFDLSYCMRPETHVERYEATVRKEAERAAAEDGFRLSLGIEWDAGSVIERERYDYVIGSVHYVQKDGELFAVDWGADKQALSVEKLFGGNKLDYAKYYFESVVEHLRRNKPDVVGHFDLLTKYGLFDEDDPAYRGIVTDAMAEAVRYVPLFEINAGAVARGLKKTPYPNPVFLPTLRALGGRILISSDAHRAAHVDFWFDEMLALVKQAGFTAVAQFENGRFVDVPI